MKKIRGIIIIVLSFIFLSLMSTKVNASSGGYTIKSMDVHVEVNDKREYIVTEKIHVYFNESRHGIYRYIPYESTLEEYKIENIYCNTNYSSSSDGKNLVLKLGDPEEYVYGDYVYEINYTLAHEDDGEDDFDYIYLNLLGDGWADTYIENFTATVITPKDSEILNYTITDGKTNSKTNTLTYGYDYGNIISIYANSPIPPRNSVTLNVKLPQGVFKNAPASIFSWASFSKKHGAKIIIILAVISVVYSLFNIFRNLKFKKDYYLSFLPPEGMSSLEVGAIYRLEVISKDVMSLIFYWASHNHLEIINEGGKNLRLKFKSQLDDNHPYYESILFNSMFSHGIIGGEVSVKDLKNVFYKDVNKTVKELKKEYKEEGALKSKGPLINSIFMIILGVLPIFAYQIFTVMAMKSSPNSYLIYLGSCVFLLGYSISIYYTLPKLEAMQKNKFMIGLQYVSSFAFIFFFVLCFLLNLVFPTLLKVPCFICIVLSIIVATKSNRPSVDFEDIYKEILGFKEFMKVAEKDRLEALIEEDPQYFYKTLPYAQVLGVTNMWADKFTDILMPEPSYYSSSRDWIGPLSIGYLIEDIGEINKANYSPVASDSGGGFSGGGSSGGGSGGGGGGSW